ncbi:hypothetical protein EB796_000867 [Bugula neritina]|uniref:Major facilitator superfamily (MFS) profile domain-containing protein n=1 Tax=Bugula neritina TaxID=10212 RepID=A0A7J7KRN3_BUGNE|nr:hypothetical protein EB796_000867 [Bugula neritina]
MTSTKSKIDYVIEQAGAFGKYQWLQLLCLCMGSFLAAFHFLIIVFHSITPKHRCKLPEWENDTFSPFSEVHNQSIYQWIPVDKDGILDSCKIYTNNNETVECEEHVFDKSVYWGVTLNQQFEMVCGNRWAGTTVKVVYTCGLIAGAFVVGVVGDRIGRKLTMIGCYFVGGAAGIVAAFSVNYYMFAAFRFFVAMSMVGIVLIKNIIILEITGPSRRVHAGAAKSFSWPLGAMLLALLSYYVQDWKWSQLIISITPLLAGFLSIFFLKETPHYLVTKGKHKEAENMFLHMASVNGKTLPENFMNELKEGEEAAVTEKLKSILKAPVLLKRTAISFYLWFVFGLSFYGLSFNVAHLTGSIYINHVIISGVASLPTIPLFFLSHRLGRKLISILSLSVGGAMLIVAAFLNAYVDLSRYSYVTIIVSMIGKIGVATVFTMSYLWCSEFYPSTLRSTLVGLSSLFARVGSVLAPIIVDLDAPNYAFHICYRMCM